jgi:hypothetical protein
VELDIETASGVGVDQWWEVGTMRFPFSNGAPVNLGVAE